MLDKRGDCLAGWRGNKQNGPSGNLKNLIPPINWIAIGINVLGKFDNVDNTWLGTSNCNGDWYIGYYGIRDKNPILGILTNGFYNDGPRQQYQSYSNENVLTKYNYTLVKKGAYFTPDINEAKTYTTINYNEKGLRVVLMCRINPHKVRIVNIGGNKEYWFTNGLTDEVRPYRILIKFENDALSLN